MELLPYIQHKPIHIGRLLYEKPLNDCEKEVGLLSDDFGLVSTSVLSDYIPKGEYHIIQFGNELIADPVFYIDPLSEFELIKLEYVDMQSLILFGYHYQNIKAIIKPDFGLNAFYYFISGSLTIDNEDLYGYFTEKEARLLSSIYK